MLASINPIAVLFATIASMALGFTWYSQKVFGAAWLEETGMDPKAAEEGMGRAMVTGFIATALMASVLSILLDLAYPATLGEALKYVALLWGATMLPAGLHGVAWDKHSWKLFAINVGNNILTLLLMTTVLWKMG